MLLFDLDYIFSLAAIFSYCHDNVVSFFIISVHAITH